MVDPTIPDRYTSQIGKHHGKLKILSVYRVVGKRKSGYFRFVCQCDCGREKDITAREVLKGNTTNCGCKRKEKAKKNQKRTNKTIGKAIQDKRYWKTDWIGCPFKQGEVKDMMGYAFCMDPQYDPFTVWPRGY